MKKTRSIRLKPLKEDKIVQIVLGTLGGCMILALVGICIFIFREDQKHRFLNEDQWLDYNAYMNRFFYSIGAEFSTTAVDRPVKFSTQQNSYNAMLAFLSDQHRAPLPLFRSTWDPKWEFAGHWQTLPISGNGQHIYNPSFIPFGESGVLIMRDENSSDFQNTEAHYWSAKAAWKDGSLGLLAAPQRLRFLDNHGQPFTSLYRRNASIEAPVVEDLRPVRGSRGLVSGVLCQHRNQASQALLQLDPNGRDVTLVATFESPFRAQIEKNWLLVQRSNTHTDVLYQFEPSLEVFQWQGLGLESKYSYPIHLPLPWVDIQQALLGNVSRMRLSALFEYSADEWLLLLHLKCITVKCMNYLTFAVHVDHDTYQPVRFLPQTLLTESGIGVSFAMDGKVDETKVHILHGVSDRISGIRSYPRTEWEARLCSWPDNAAILSLK
jgi:hypothetical protein